LAVSLRQQRPRHCAFGRGRRSAHFAHFRCLCECSIARDLILFTSKSAGRPWSQTRTSLVCKKKTFSSSKHVVARRPNSNQSSEVDEQGRDTNKRGRSVQTAIRFVSIHLNLNLSW
jgi:hypothetical protein